MSGVFPRHIAIEIHGYCNGHCSYCPKGVRTPNISGFMQMDLFQRLIREIRETGIESMRFSSLSETLIHKDVLPYIAAAEGLPTYINTNMSMCDAAMLKGLEDAGFTGVLRCHVQPNMGLDYQLQLANFNHARAQWGEKRVLLTPVIHAMRFAGTAPLRQARHCAADLMEDDMVVLWDGSVIQCCVAEHVIDSVRDNSIKNVWCGAPFDIARHNLSLGMNHLCNLCDRGVE